MTTPNTPLASIIKTVLACALGYLLSMLTIIPPAYLIIFIGALPTTFSEFLENYHFERHSHLVNLLIILIANTLNAGCAFGILIDIVLLLLGATLHLFGIPFDTYCNHLLYP